MLETLQKMSDEDISSVSKSSTGIDLLLDLSIEALLPSFLATAKPDPTPGTFTHAALQVLQRVARTQCGLNNLVSHRFAALDVLLAGSYLAAANTAVPLLLCLTESSPAGLEAVRKAASIEQKVAALYAMWEADEQGPGEPLAEHTAGSLEPCQLLGRLQCNDGATAASCDRIRHNLAHCTRRTWDANGFKPYVSFGTDPIYTAFACHVRLLTRLTMSTFRCTPAVWSDHMPRYTVNQQRRNMERLRRTHKEIVASKKLLKDPNLSQEESSATRDKCKRNNRDVAGVVYGIDSSVFEVLAERKIFSATRQFSADAKAYDESLTRAHIVQGGRNVWTCFALQVIYNSQPAACNPAVFGYSLLYPYTDNFLDSHDISMDRKLKFQEQFRKRLSGTHTIQDTPDFTDGVKAFEQVDGIESVWDRAKYPEVFASLVAINDAQTWSLSQHDDITTHTYSDLLEKTVYKGTSC